MVAAGPRYGRRLAATHTLLRVGISEYRIIEYRHRSDDNNVIEPKYDAGTATLTVKATRTDGRSEGFRICTYFLTIFAGHRDVVLSRAMARPLP